MKTLVFSLTLLISVSATAFAQSGDNYKHQVGKKKSVKEKQVITVSEEHHDYKHTFSNTKDTTPAEKSIVKTGAQKKSYKHQVPQKRN